MGDRKKREAIESFVTLCNSHFVENIGLKRRGNKEVFNRI